MAIGLSFDFTQGGICTNAGPSSCDIITDLDVLTVLSIIMKSMEEIIIYTLLLPDNTRLDFPEPRSRFQTLTHFHLAGRAEVIFDSTYVANSIHFQGFRE